MSGQMLYAEWNDIVQFPGGNLVWPFWIGDQGATDSHKIEIASIEHLEKRIERRGRRGLPLHDTFEHFNIQAYRTHGDHGFSGYLLDPAREL